MNTENNEYNGKYSCAVCKLNFRRKDRLERHEFIHTGIKNFKCDYENCDKVYTNSSHLNRHVKNCHIAKPKINSFVCDYPKCLQGFTNMSNMNRHYKKSHVNIPVQKCDQCESEFRRRDQLKRHLKRIHNSGSYPYQCEKCEKGYFNKFAYSKHVEIHNTKECSDCHQIFNKWTQLVVHRREEHKRKNGHFECDLCGKIFLQKPNIKKHMKIHLIETFMYSCQYENCSKFYTEKRNLNAHIRSKHEGKKFICEICKKNLSSNQKLQQHIAAHDDSIKSKYLTEKSKIALLLGIKLHKNIQNELLNNIPLKNLIDGASTETECSDN